VVRPGPVYETSFVVAAGAGDTLEQWLADRKAHLRLQRGVLDCQLFALRTTDEKAADNTADDVEGGRTIRGYRVVFDGDEALEQFLTGVAADIAAEAPLRFGDDVESHARVLREVDPDLLRTVENPDCLNCGTRLAGQYCGQCGQRARSRLISLWELIRDAFGDLFELDSRLWRTLLPLLGRPGLLTHDYLQGRRARYMPPFRMYLVMSLLFFLVAFFDPRESLSLLFEPQAAAEPETAGLDESKGELEREIAGELHGEVTIGDEARGTSESEQPGNGVEAGGSATEPDAEDGQKDDCDAENFAFEGPGWLKRRLTPERLSRACTEVQRDDGSQLAGKVVDNIPAALIVLLPIMAFVLTLLYPLSRRYYVEHLLFFIHFHAFFFLLLILQILFGRIAGWAGLPESLAVLIIVISSFYIPVYLYVAMRRVYGQGRLVTFAKYVVLSVAYLGGFVVTMLGALLIAAFSI